MKKGLKKGLKILATVMLLVTALAVTAGLIFGVKGYFLYRQAFDETPLSEKVEEIRQQDHLFLLKNCRISTCRR